MDGGGEKDVVRALYPGKTVWSALCLNAQICSNALAVVAEWPVGPERRGGDSPSIKMKSKEQCWMPTRKKSEHERRGRLYAVACALPRGEIRSIASAYISRISILIIAT